MALIAASKGRKNKPITSTLFVLLLLKVRVFLLVFLAKNSYTLFFFFPILSFSQSQNRGQWNKPPKWNPFASFLLNVVFADFVFRTKEGQIQRKVKDEPHTIVGLLECERNEKKRQKRVKEYERANSKVCSLENTRPIKDGKNFSRSKFCRLCSNLYQENLKRFSSVFVFTSCFSILNSFYAQKRV